MGAGVGLLGSGSTCLHEADCPLSPADLNGMAPELPVAMPSGPFRHMGLSKAARTHRLRKLRTPAKCRECNSYVYFQGAECEEVSGAQGQRLGGGHRAFLEATVPGGYEGFPGQRQSQGSLSARLQCCLACHKKCLETLAIQCGHKKLQGRLQLFGQDFSRAARRAPDGVPFVIRKCVCEIEQRALHTKVATRVGRGSPWGRGPGPRLTVAPTGHLPGQRGEDACGEAVPGLRGWRGAGGALPGLATRYQQRAQALPAPGVLGTGGAGLAQGGRGCALTHDPRSCLSRSYPFGSTMSLWGWPRTA